MKCVENCEVMTYINITHLNIHKDLVKKCFPRTNVKFQNVTTSLFLIRFSSFLHQSEGKFITLSFEIIGNSGLDFHL